MSLLAVCPACQQSYQLAEAVGGKKVRCKSCGEIFVAGMERRSPASRPREDEPEDRFEDSPRPRRQKKQGANPAIPLIIAGGVAGALVLVLAAGAAWWLSTTRQPTP